MGSHVWDALYGAPCMSSQFGMPIEGSRKCQMGVDIMFQQVSTETVW